MTLSDEGREAIQQSNRARNFRCGKCGSTGTYKIDGEKIGGFAGLEYLYCPGCGWSRSVTPRRTQRRPQ